MVTPSIPPSSEHPTLTARTILNSWKEIADYLDRGVRTVQRWEGDLALPVRRPSGRSRSAVIALRSDIDDWLRSRPFAKADFPSMPQQADLAGGEPSPRPSEIVQESRLLRAQLARSRRELNEAVAHLKRSVQRSMAELDSSSAPCFGR